MSGSLVYGYFAMLIKPDSCWLTKLRAKAEITSVSLKLERLVFKSLKL